MDFNQLCAFFFVLFSDWKLIWLLSATAATTNYYHIFQCVDKCGFNFVFIAFYFYSWFIKSKLIALSTENNDKKRMLYKLWLYNPLNSLTVPICIYITILSNLKTYVCHKLSIIILFFFFISTRQCTRWKFHI